MALKCTSLFELGNTFFNCELEPNHDGTHKFVVEWNTEDERWK